MVAGEEDSSPRLHVCRGISIPCRLQIPAPVSWKQGGRWSLASHLMPAGRRERISSNSQQITVWKGIFLLLYVHSEEVPLSFCMPSIQMRLTIPGEAARSM